MNSRESSRSLVALAGLLVLAFCLAGPHARAGVTRTVTTLEDAVNGDSLLSLREAIGASANGDRIRFAVTGVIELTRGELVIQRDLVIAGPGARRLTIRRQISAPHFRIFHIPSETTIVSLSGLTMEYGIASRGGGILNSGRLTVTGCSFRENFATGVPEGHGLGGGIYNLGVLTVRECCFTSNGAHGTGQGGTGYGGGISNGYGGRLFAANTTLIGNLGFNGAAVHSQGPTSNPAASLTGCTVSYNGGGYAVLVIGRALLRSTIIARNETSADFTGAFESAGYNLIGRRENAAGTWQPTDKTGTILSPLDPRFEMNSAGEPLLRNNGGETDTVALLADSAALDAGDNTLPMATDQRGFPRRIGPRVDIGAYERDRPQTGASLVVNTLDDQSDGIAGVSHCSLREAIEAANADTAADTVTFRKGLAGTIRLDPALGRLRIVYPLTIAGPGARTLTVSGGRATSLFVNNASPTVISGLTLADGLDTDGSGGPAVLNLGMLSLRACTVRNHFGLPGELQAPAVLTLDEMASLDVRECTFHANTGGALANVSSKLVVTNSTLSGNVAGIGAGIYNIGQLESPTAYTTLLNCTVAGNTAAESSIGGGGLYNWPGNSFRLRNTIVALNGSAGPGPDAAGAFTSLGNNLIGKSDGSSGWVASDRRGTKAAPLNPRLGGLSDNGGPTHTRALLAGSPALNAAHPTAAPPRDQRGYERPNPADIGAFELGGIPVDPPVNVSVTPSAAVSNTGVARTLTARYSDGNGAADLKAGYLLVNSSPTLATGFYAYYNAVANRLYLRNAANTGWVGGAIPGSAATIHAPNGTGSLHCAQTTVSRSGDTLTVNWRVTPNPSLAGSRTVYLNCQDRRDQSAGWEALGTWSIQAPPVNEFVSPESGASRVGVARTLAARYSDANGASDLAETKITIHTAPGGGLVARYDAVANKLYLRHSTTGAWLGGAAPGTASVISDPGGRGSLNCGATSVTRSGNNLTVRWSLTPGSNLVGAKNIYLWAKDQAGLADGWDLLGTWNVTP